MNKGSIMKLIKNIHKGTPGTGQKDDVPASIEGTTPAALSEGEYVFDAETVALIGDGNTEAGARILDEFRKELRRVKGKQLAKGKQSDPLSKINP
jgi:hypothetical protein